MNRNIQIKGIEQLSEEERKAVEEILDNSYEKLKRRTKTDFLLKLAIKEYSKNLDNKNKRKKYSIQAQISGDVREFEASADDWDLRKVLHKVFEKLDNEIEHAFHSSEQNR
jgi:ribosome-associated translation inhibitor RaiA